MPITSNFDLPSPDTDDAPNVPADIKALADAAETALTATVLDSGWVAVTAIAPFTVSSDAAVRKIGKMVVSRGYITRATGSATGMTDAAQLPSGYEPSADSFIQIGNPTSSTTIAARARIIASTRRIQVGMSGANAGEMSIVNTWFTD